ncbi:mitochondrial protein Pet127-domain-containing protein [Xylariales sp. PMI_506]|nr:mitochondrial protein Pet127-domain-containing protein [Xylariales sp. PMI_506]
MDTVPNSKLRKDKQKGKSASRKALQIRAISARSVPFEAVAEETVPVPRLSYGLERVLFNPGVYHLQDPRSRVYNFDPYLSKIMPTQQFDFTALKQYVTSSKDERLISIARKYQKKYTGSTSSMTSMLSHFHYLLSSWREVNSGMMSQSFPVESRRFTRIMRAPAAAFLHWKDGVYAIDADKEFDSANILSMLGKSMEKLLTLPKEGFERYRRQNSDQITEEERNAEESFHYSTLGDFMMRSQLDAHDPRVPGSGMFDLKTRAVVSVRMDSKEFQKGQDYEIRQRFGPWESYEREYHDMIRSAFLKYSLQVRMGRMDGIFVAFHNTQRIFGFQYIPLEEMDLAIHGTSNLSLGAREFQISLGLLNDVLNRATKAFPQQSLRLHIETRESLKAPFMYIFAKPVAPGEIKAVQEASKASVEEFEQNMMNSTTPDATGDASADNLTDSEESPVEKGENIDGAQPVEDMIQWDEIQSVVDKAIDDEELGVGAVRDAIEDALDESGLLLGFSLEDAHSPESSDSTDPTTPTASGTKPEDEVPAAKDLIGFVLTIRNKVNSRYVERPEDLKVEDKWLVEYSIKELEPQRASTLYQMCKERRRKMLYSDGKKFGGHWGSTFRGELNRYSKKGYAYRTKENKMAKRHPVWVLGGDGPKTYEQSPRYPRHVNTMQFEKIPEDSKRQERRTTEKAPSQACSL